MAKKDEETDFLDQWTAEETPPPEVKEDEPAQEAEPEPLKEVKPEPDAQQGDAVKTAETPQDPPPDKPKFPPKEGKEPLTAEEVKALIDMRREADEAKRQRDEFKRKAEFYEQQQQQKRAAENQPPPPDQLDEPEKYQAWQRQQWQDALINERLNVSEMIVRQTVGDEKVDAAIAAIKEFGDDATRSRLYSSKNPYGDLLKWHEEHQTITAIREAGSLDALIEKKLAERASAQQPPAQQAQSPVATPKPDTPPSLVKGGSGRTQTPSERQTEEEFFSGVFRS